MASLSAHLRETEAHGRLSFHPECPICCRERLSGTLPRDALVGRRTEAAVLAAVLAVSTAAPAAAAAQEPDQVSEGTVAPGEAAQDPALDPDFDPGGESDDLPFDEPDAPVSEPAPDPELGDPGPVEQEPAADVDAPVADAGDGAEEPPAATPSPTPTPTPLPSAGDEQSTGPLPSDPADDVVAPPTEASADEEPGRRHTRRDRDGKKDSHDDLPAPVVVAPPTRVAPNAPSEVAPVAEAPAPVVTVATRGSAEPGDRVHVVRAGESLWSIARDLVGHDASAARIARQVNSLWELNRTRIGTGDPNLLMVGTRLTLR